MYTVEETYNEINTMQCPLICDKTYHTANSEIRVISWKTIAEKSGYEQPVFVIRSWVDSQWNDTNFTLTFDRATVIIDAFEYGV